MGVPYADALKNLNAAVDNLFAADPTVRAVGIGRHEEAFGYRLIRNARTITPQGGVVNALAAIPQATVPTTIANIPVTVVDGPGEIRSQVLIAGNTGTTQATPTHIPEVLQTRPLLSGLQIENFDDDSRSRAAGSLQPGFMIVGTLGCFVRLADGTFALLSNNHVVAAENHGVVGTDEIYQPGSPAVDPTQQIGILSRFKPIIPSPPGAAPPDPTVVFNDIDAGISVLADQAGFAQRYLPSRHLVAPTGIAAPSIGDTVFKVGRTTGLTRGTITSIGTTVGPVTYRDGPSWFSNSIEIEGVSGTLFSDHGDSGSAIVKDNGEVVGLLYAGNGAQTYACTIDNIFAFFGCTLA